MVKHSSWLCFVRWHHDLTMVRFCLSICRKKTSFSDDRIRFFGEQTIFEFDIIFLKSLLIHHGTHFTNVINPVISFYICHRQNIMLTSKPCLPVSYFCLLICKWLGASTEMKCSRMKELNYIDPHIASFCKWINQNCINSSIKWPLYKHVSGPNNYCNSSDKI